ncbi:MAG: hypothetical protein DRR00_12795 [Candidatus Parabeggiatoa sp. nov. 3]|nr:MAG: hypothetical protein DRR00_12795 [Gammaproteobacteria bacterium]
MGITFHAKVLRAKLLREKLFQINLVGNKNTLPTLHKRKYLKTQSQRVGSVFLCRPHWICTWA